MILLGKVMIFALYWILLAGVFVGVQASNRCQINNNSQLPHNVTTTEEKNGDMAEKDAFIEIIRKENKNLKTRLSAIENSFVTLLKVSEKLVKENKELKEDVSFFGSIMAEEGDNQELKVEKQRLEEKLQIMMFNMTKQRFPPGADILSKLDFLQKIYEATAANNNELNSKLEQVVDELRESEKKSELKSEKINFLETKLLQREISYNQTLADNGNMKILISQLNQDSKKMKRQLEESKHHNKVIRKQAVGINKDNPNQTLRTILLENQLRNSEQRTEAMKAQMSRCSSKLNQTDLIPETCQGWKDLGFDTSGKYIIASLAERPFLVSCDMHGKNGQAATMIHHNSETRIKVHPKCDPTKCYNRKINYSASQKQILRMLRISSYCEQFIKYECWGSRLFYKINGNSFAAWYSRDGQEMDYWGGAPPGSNKCACGMTNSCANTTKAFATGNCNCDNNDFVLREDSGYLVDKSTLPVSQMAFGDTKRRENGYHTLGPLVCYQ